MRLLRCVSVLFVLGCGSERSEPLPNDRPSETSGHQYAAVKGTRTIVVAERPPGPTLDSILTDHPTGFWWVRIEIPDPISASAYEADLQISNAAVIFAQSYRDSCNPVDALNTQTCWLVERYVAGDESLKGRVSIALSEAGDITGGYSVYWEGETDRFEGPIQWHSHESTGGFSVPADNVIEVAQ